MRVGIVAVWLVLGAVKYHDEMQLEVGWVFGVTYQEGVWVVRGRT